MYMYKYVHINIHVHTYSRRPGRRAKADAYAARPVNKTRNNKVYVICTRRKIYVYIYIMCTYIL